MRQITDGQYIAGGSLIHCLDARVKLAGLFLLFAAIAGADTAAGYIIVITAVIGICLLSKMSFYRILSPIKKLWQFFLLIFFMNALFFDASGDLINLWILHISTAGIWQGFKVSINVILVLITGNVLMLTTLPMGITSALESLLKPLRVLFIPTEEAAMILSIAIQFIPTLYEETETIKKAQIARGARFESKKLTERAKSFLPLVVPVFISAFKRADELSTAMEARGYRGAKNRTKKAKVPLHKCDYIAVAFCMVLCILQFTLLR